MNSDSVADSWHYGMDLDLDTRIHTYASLMDSDLDSDPDIFVIDLLEDNKKQIFCKVFLLITFWRYIYIIFQRYKVKKKSQNSRNQGFS